MREATSRLAFLVLLCACGGGGSAALSDLEPGPSPAPTPADPLLAASTGIVRIQKFTHPGSGSHSGVDAVPMPRWDAVSGDWRDEWLLVSSAGTGVYGALVDEGWNVLHEQFLPSSGLPVVWSDVSAVRIADVHGRERAFVYFVSRGSNELQISDVTDFPDVTTVRWPIDIGLPVQVRGVHTMRIDAERGLMALNAVDVAADPMPAPLTPGCSPVVFFDLKADPLRPRRLSMFVGPDAGDQTLFDSCFVDIDGRPVWAATIQQPQQGNQSYFAFYDATDPGAMDRATRLSHFGGPATGTFHNLVALPPGPDGAPRLAAGFEAFAFQAAADVLVSKAAVFDARDLLAGAKPTVVGWLADAHNHAHSVHNPASRLLESRAHTHDAVPLAHFTGGYFCYEIGDGQDSVAMLAHAPICAVAPSAEDGRYHANMTVPAWAAVYNGAWDAVATPIGDFASSTDLEASYLIEPQLGFVRHFGRYRPHADGRQPKLRVLSGIPTVGAALLVEAEGLVPGVEARLVVSAEASEEPMAHGDLGALHLDADQPIADLRLLPSSSRAVFELPSIPSAERLAFVLVQRIGGEAARSKTAVVRVRQQARRLAAAPRAWRLPEGHVHSGSCCGLR